MLFFSSVMLFPRPRLLRKEQWKRKSCLRKNICIYVGSLSERSWMTIQRYCWRLRRRFWLTNTKWHVTWHVLKNFANLQITHIASQFWKVENKCSIRLQGDNSTVQSLGRGLWSGKQNTVSGKRFWSKKRPQGWSLQLGKENSRLTGTGTN